MWALQINQVRLPLELCNRHLPHDPLCSGDLFAAAPPITFQSQLIGMVVSRKAGKGVMLAWKITRPDAQLAIGWRNGSSET